MELSDLAEIVGRDRFERACVAASATAEHTGGGHDEPWPEDLRYVPHELSDAVEGDVGLAFALYRAMPCYANLMYVGHWGIGPAFWAQLRTLVGGPDPKLATPAMYWLWCGPFEAGDATTVTAWREMTTGADDRLLRTLLDASGPVPWPMKAPYLESLAAQPDWHPIVRRAVEAAATEYYGAIDKPAALRLLRRVGCTESEIQGLAQGNS